MVKSSHGRGGDTEPYSYCTPDDTAESLAITRILEEAFVYHGAGLAEMYVVRIIRDFISNDISGLLRYDIMRRERLLSTGRVRRFRKFIEMKTVVSKKKILLKQRGTPTGTPDTSADEGEEDVEMKSIVSKKKILLKQRGSPTGTPDTSAEEGEEDAPGLSPLDELVKGKRGGVVLHDTSKLICCSVCRCVIAESMKLKHSKTKSHKKKMKGRPAWHKVTKECRLCNWSTPAGNYEKPYQDHLNGRPHQRMMLWMKCGGALTVIQ